MRAPQGFFVTLDGPSGVGKTTVSRLLHNRLTTRGLPVVLTSQPSSSPIGELVRHGTYEYHGIALACLIAADRYHHVAVMVRQALAVGRIVVCDRYVPSSLVLDRLDGVELTFLFELYRDIDWPDLAIFMSADPALCRARLEARGIHSRFQTGGLEASESEAKLYHSVAAQLTEKHYPVLAYKIAKQSADQVASALLTDVMIRYKKTRSDPV